MGTKESFPGQPRGTDAELRSQQVRAAAAATGGLPAEERKQLQEALAEIVERTFTGNLVEDAKTIVGFWEQDTGKGMTLKIFQVLCDELKGAILS